MGWDSRISILFDGSERNKPAQIVWDELQDPGRHAFTIVHRHDRCRLKRGEIGKQRFQLSTGIGLGSWTLHMVRDHMTQASPGPAPKQSKFYPQFKGDQRMSPVHHPKKHALRF